MYTTIVDHHLCPGERDAGCTRVEMAVVRGVKRNWPTKGLVTRQGEVREVDRMSPPQSVSRISTSRDRLRLSRRQNEEVIMEVDKGMRWVGLKINKEW